MAIENLSCRFGTCETTAGKAEGAAVDPVGGKNDAPALKPYAAPLSIIEGKRERGGISIFTETSFSRRRAAASDSYSRSVTSKGCVSAKQPRGCLATAEKQHWPHCRPENLASDPKNKRQQELEEE
uniref:Uncharacterized protein n=1 Tax=Romanomermis culicivorax TaxID=13658 RepID=A0A915II90_ROMCU